MWPRVLEVVLGCWLAISPFVFRHAADRAGLWVNDFVCALLITVLALGSLHRRTFRLHLGQLAVAAWLLGVAFARSTPPPAPYQNYVTVALLLVIFAILPVQIAEPPRAWREFYGPPEP